MVKYYVYTPFDLAKGIVQIFHDVGEHMGRYGEFAEYLSSMGYIVCGCDMPGFGGSVNEGDIKGYFGNGKALETPANANKALYDIMRSKYRYLPYSFYSNGVGALVVKKLLLENKDCADGIVFSGAVSEFDPMTKILCKVVSLFKGKKGCSPMLDNRCFSKGEREFGSENCKYSYLSSIEEERGIYQNDVHCLVPVTAASLNQIADAVSELAAKRWNEEYPSGVYTLILYGKNDPIGGFGSAAGQLYDGLEEFARVCDMERVEYETSRHDLLHDVDKDKVYKKAVEFFDKVVDGVNSARTTDAGIIIR